MFIKRATLEEASAHKSAKTHAGTVFVTRDLDLWPFDPKVNGFPTFIGKNAPWSKSNIRLKPRFEPNKNISRPVANATYLFSQLVLQPC